MIFCYHPQRSCEGYVFTGICLSTGGPLGGSAPGGPGPGGGGAWSGGVGIPACTEADPPGKDGYCCGRYASYWNAFLLVLVVSTLKGNGDTRILTAVMEFI